MEGGKSALTHRVCVLVKSSEAPNGLAESWIKIGVIGLSASEWHSAINGDTF